MIGGGKDKESGGFLRGLGRSSAKLSSGIAGLFTKRKLDREMLDELEELLITCDLGVGAAARVAEQLGNKRLDKDATPDEIRGFLADEIAAVLTVGRARSSSDEPDSSRDMRFSSLALGWEGQAMATSDRRVGDASR